MKPALRSCRVRTVDAAPRAAALLEGLRDFGYRLETALADIVDNSIAAGARRVDLVAETSEENPWIAIVDNGTGMTKPELIEAMRLGSKNPRDLRDASDLGRFGLGLKSASLSQCRRLTVLTRKSGKTSCARWDLDRVARQDDWLLEVPDDVSSVAANERLGKSGTVVVWEKLDRLSEGVSHDRDRCAAHLNAELSKSERHLRLVFQRYIAGTPGRGRKLKLALNGRDLSPIDPMASSFPSTQETPQEEIKLGSEKVRVLCRTLPHHSMMPKDAWEELGGPEGHLRSQGLYVYRNDRLVIAGGWMGLARQTELTKLCRVSVDIPNTMDSEWKIDVRKASAQLPPAVRDRLRELLRNFLGMSKRTYVRRGTKLVSEDNFPFWNRIQQDGAIVYRPNFDHPVFEAFRGRLPEELAPDFARCLQLLGSGLPIATLHSDFGGNAEAIKRDEPDDAVVLSAAQDMADRLISRGMQYGDILEAIRCHPVFDAHRDKVGQMLASYLEEGGFRS